MHTGIQVNRKRPSARELIVFKWKRGQKAVLVPIYESRWTSHYRIIAHAHYSYMEIICYVLLSTFIRRTWSCWRKAPLLDRRRTIQVTKLLLTHYHDRIRFSSYIFQYKKKTTIRRRGIHWERQHHAVVFLIAFQEVNKAVWITHLWLSVPPTLSAYVPNT